MIIYDKQSSATATRLIKSNRRSTTKKLSTRNIGIFTFVGLKVKKMKEIKNDIYDVLEEPVSDNSITRFDYVIIQPFNTTAFGNSDEIRLSIQQQEKLPLLHESRLYIEGTAENGADPTKGMHDETGFTNNAAQFLQREIRYEMNGVELDQTRNVGITTTIKGILSFNEEENRRLRNSTFDAKNENKAI